MAIGCIQKRTVNFDLQTFKYKRSKYVYIYHYRDIGEHIRQKVANSFTHGEASKVDISQWSKFIEHLGNIANNKSLIKHPRTLKSTATGLSVEDCKQIVSTDFLRCVQGQESFKNLSTSTNKKNAD